MEKLFLFRIFFCGLLIALGLAGCGTGTTDIAAPNADATAAAPTLDLEAAVSDDTGAVQAVLYYTDQPDRPARMQIVYLADLLPITGGTLKDSFVPALDATTAPGGETDNSGHLLISKVKPGLYVLILMTPVGPIMLTTEDGQKEIRVEVKAGEVIDLGKVMVSVDPEILETP